MSDLDTDFRVGGHETDRGEPGTYEARYHDIVPDERIVVTYDLSLGGSRVSVSLATVEFRPTGDGSGTHMSYTEYGAFLDGLDDPELRKNGTGGMLDELGRMRNPVQADDWTAEVPVRFWSPKRTTVR